MMKKWYSQETDRTLYSELPTSQNHCRLTFKSFKSGSCQSIGGRPADSSAVFALEKWRQPKNPRVAESGEGCGAFKTVCRFVSIHSAFRWA